MDNEKIKKFIRLAVNNTNEHEANLAARKACQALYDGNWDGIANTNSRQTVPNQQRATTYNDIRRSTEPQWKPTKPTVESDYNYYDPKPPRPNPA